MGALIDENQSRLWEEGKEKATHVQLQVLQGCQEGNRSGGSAALKNYKPGSQPTVVGDETQN
jgi:hypothetical protein